MAKNRVFGFAALVLAVLIWSSAYLVLRSVGGHLEGRVFGFLSWRFFLASLVLALMAWPSRKRASGLWMPSLVLGGFLAAGYILQFFALIDARNSATSVAFVTSLIAPMLVLAGMVLGEKTETLKVFALLLSVLGLYLLSFAQASNLLLRSQLIALSATISFAVYFVAFSRFAKRGFEPILLTTGSMVACAMFVTLSAIIYGGPHELLLPSNAYVVGTVVFAAVLVTGVGLVLKNYGVANTDLVSSGAVVVFEPVLVAIFSYVFVHERLTSIQITGAAVIFVSSVMLKFPKKPKQGEDQ